MAGPGIHKILPNMKDDVWLRICVLIPVILSIRIYCYACRRRTDMHRIESYCGLRQTRNARLERYLNNRYRPEAGYMKTSELFPWMKKQVHTKLNDLGEPMPRGMNNHKVVLLLDGLNNFQTHMRQYHIPPKAAKYIYRGVRSQPICEWGTCLH